MKLNRLFLTLAAIAATAVSCVKDELAQLDEVQVSQSYIALPTEGGSCDVTVTATGSWEITDIPEWLTVAPASGVAGKTVVTFSAEATSTTNESVLKLLCSGKTQLLTVLQMADKVELPITSCAEVNAAEDGITFKIKGTITAIENTTYGNLYVTDETGSVYIYGTLYEGAEKQFSKYGVEVGDIVVVEGPRGSYKGSPQLVNATILAIEKSLIKVESVDPETAELPIEGGILTVTLTAKGDGVEVVIPEENKSWISVSGMNVSGTSAVVSFNIAENAGGDRSSELSFKTTKSGKEYTAVTSFSQKGAIIEATAAEINAAADGDTQYRITGYVSKVANTQYGNLYIRDHSGEVYVYGTNDFANTGIEEGDIITVVGPKTSHNDKPQMKNVTLENRIDVKDIDLASFKALADDSETWYRISGTVAESTEPNTKLDLETYGNLALTDGTNEVYVYGVVPGWGGASKLFGTLGVKLGDKLTIVCHKASFTKDEYTLHQASKAFYVSHETPEVGGGEDASTTITLTVEGLPASYPNEENVVTLGGKSFAILKVANFGSGIQCKKEGSYLYNTESLGKIKSVKLTVQSGKTWYKDNLKVYAGSSANPTAEVAIASSDETGSVYDFSAVDAGFLKIENPSGYAVYMEKIEIVLAE